MLSIFLKTDYSFFVVDIFANEPLKYSLKLHQHLETKTENNITTVEESQYPL